MKTKRQSTKKYNNHTRNQKFYLSTHAVNMSKQLQSACDTNIFKQIICYTD